MKDKNNKSIRRCFQYTAWTISFVVIIGASFLLVFYSLSYQNHKIKQFFMAFFFGLAKKIFLNDALFLTLQSGVYACSGFEPKEFYYQKKKSVDPRMVRVEHLTTKLNSLKRMFYFHSFEEQKHDIILRDAEKTREHYKEVVRDLIMFFFYFVTLFMIVMATKDRYSYHTKETIRNFIVNPTVYNLTTHPPWREYPIGQKQLLQWINTTFVNNINDGQKYTGEKYDEPGWVTFGLGKILGVVRLRQHRGNNTYAYDKSDYSTGWTKNAEGKRYSKELWRIAEPWIYRTGKESASRPLFGKLYYHPPGGYIAQLGRTKINSIRMLNFLYKNNWYDENTQVLFIEFCLYNVDTNLFIIVNIVIERTPFEFQVTAVHVEPVKLLVIIQNLGTAILIAFYIYLIMIFIFTYNLASVIRNDKLKELYKSAWNIFDTILIIFSIIMIIFFFVRSTIVEKLLKRLENVRNNEFVSFEPVLLFDYVVSYLSALLVCIALVRIWKVLHFSSKFRVFTITLKRAAGELFATVCCMGIFFIAFGLAICLINGNHSEALKNPYSAITQSVAYGLGFGRQSHVEQLFKGGKLFGSLIGFLSYIFLIGVCAIFLVNMFITVACIYLTEVQNDQKIARPYSFSFWKFVKLEYGIHHIVCRDKGQKKSCSKKKYPYYQD